MFEEFFFSNIIFAKSGAVCIVFGMTDFGYKCSMIGVETPLGDIKVVSN